MEAARMGLGTSHKAKNTSLGYMLLCVALLMLADIASPRAGDGASAQFSPDIRLSLSCRGP